MLQIIKRLRVVALTGAVLLTSTGAALAASLPLHASNPAAVTTSTLAPAPDCVAPCTRLLQPQQQVVVGAPYYAFHSATASATATGFGAQFSVRYSPDGNNYTTIYQTPTATTNAFKAIFNMPGYYRVVAVNTALSLLTTNVSVNITVSYARALLGRRPRRPSVIARKRSPANRVRCRWSSRKAAGGLC